MHFLCFVVEVSILTRDRKASATKIDVLSFQQVDSFIKNNAPAPESRT
jgi:hypothetical protein